MCFCILTFFILPIASYFTVLYYKRLSGFDRPVMSNCALGFLNKCINIIIFVGGGGGAVVFISIITWQASTPILNLRQGERYRIFLHVYVVKKIQEVRDAQSNRVW